MSAAIIDKSSRHTLTHAKKRAPKARKGSMATLKKSAGGDDNSKAAGNGSSDPAELAEFIDVAISHIIILDY